jgi:hypothetical protein
VVLGGAPAHVYAIGFEADESRNRQSARLAGSGLLDRARRLTRNQREKGRNCK